MKRWGRVKIRYELKQKQVGDYLIKKALASIDEEDYSLALAKLAADKWEALREETNVFVRRKKVQDYLLQRGFEAGLITEAVNRAPGANN
jgi:regulatory protein